MRRVGVERAQHRPWIQVQTPCLPHLQMNLFKKINRPVGSPASTKTLHSINAVRLVSSLGLQTQVQPAFTLYRKLHLLTSDSGPINH